VGVNKNAIPTRNNGIGRS